MGTVFYSWQSDRPPAINRTFIEKCLDNALKDVGTNDTREDSPRVEIDQGTQGVPGSPDIAATILQKIAAADVFVCDLTFVDDPPSDVRRRFPNPNVLYELGYAVGKLGWSKIVCVFNKSFGPVNKLPFDWGWRKALLYELPQEVEKTEQRASLTRQLSTSIRTILESPDEEEIRKQEEDEQFFLELSVPIISTCVWLSHANEFRGGTRHVLQDRFLFLAGLLRQAALKDTAHDRGIVAEIHSLADRCDNIGHFQLLGGSGPAFRDLIAETTQIANALESKHVRGRADDHLLCNTVKEYSRELNTLQPRVHDMLFSRRCQEAIGIAHTIGSQLLLYSHISGEEATKSKLEQIGTRLFLLATIDTRSIDGGRSLGEIESRINSATTELAELLRELEKPR